MIDRLKQVEKKYFRKKEEKSKLVELHNKLKLKFENYIIEQQNQPSKSNILRVKPETQDKTLSARVIPIEKKSIHKQSSLREIREEKLFELGPVQNIQRPIKRQEIQIKVESIGKKPSDKSTH